MGFLEKVTAARPAKIMDFMSTLKKTHTDVEEMVDLWSQMDGMAGLFRTKDGNAYEVTVRPAKYSQHPGIKKKIEKRSK